MAKRKSRKIAPKKRKEPALETVFNCPYCNYSKCIRVAINRKASSGSLNCVVCSASFTCNIGVLSQAVDVYAQWIDESVQANKEANKEANSKLANKKRQHASDGHDGHDTDHPNRLTTQNDGNANSTTQHCHANTDLVDDVDVNLTDVDKIFADVNLGGDGVNLGNGRLGEDRFLGEVQKKRRLQLPQTEAAW